jgi:putative DNA primase/helicase
MTELYHSELLAAGGSQPIFICEDEEDVNALEMLMFVATCKVAGEWSVLALHFKDREVFVLANAGQEIARALDGIAASVRVLDLLAPVTELLEEDPTGARLMRTAKATPLWEPIASTSNGTSASDQELVAELAALPSLEYAKRRKDAAEKIGIGVGELDKIVAEARGEEPEPTPARWAVEPWPTEVLTADLLQGLVDVYRKHVVLPEHGAEAMALWCLHCWAIDAAYVSPFLMLTSPEPRCGKSTTLALLYRTVPRSAFASNISSASVFRYIDSCHPVLLIDEADTFARDDDALRGILNSGHSRDTAFVIRCEGDDNFAKEFSTWSAKAVAAIGKLADTWRDRAIILPLKRKKPDEVVTKLRARDSEAFVNLRRKAARWVADNLEALKGAQPELSEVLHDRAQDNWESLLAIADIAGGDWPRTARAAAVALSSSAEATDDTIRVQLLTDIAGIFASHNCDRIFSKRLLGELADDETKSWASYKNNKPITERQIARLLVGFGIKPSNQRIGDAQAKGYALTDFADALERYVPRVTVDSTVPTVPDNNISNLELNLSVPNKAAGTDKNDGKPLKTKAGTDGTARHPWTGKKGICAQCEGAIDGTEQPHECADGRMVWLHEQCRSFFEEERPW